MKYGGDTSLQNIGASVTGICKHCNKPIARRAQNGPWKHVGGSYNCDNTNFLQAEPKRN